LQVYGSVLLVLIPLLAARMILNLKTNTNIKSIKNNNLVLSISMEKKLCDCVYQSILPEISSLNELSLNIKLLKKNEQLIFTMENKQFSDLRAVLMSILYLVKASIESMNNLILVNT